MPFSGLSQKEWYLHNIKMKAAIYGTSTTAPLQRASRMENAFWFSQGKDNFQVMVFQKVIYVVNVNGTHGFLRDFCLSHIVARLCEPNHDAPRTRHTLPLGLAPEVFSNGTQGNAIIPTKGEVCCSTSHTRKSSWVHWAVRTPLRNLKGKRMANSHFPVSHHLTKLLFNQYFHTGGRKGMKDPAPKEVKKSHC